MDTVETIQKNDGLWKGLSNWWAGLVEPSDKVTGIVARRKAKLLASMMLYFGILNLILNVTLAIPQIIEDAEDFFEGNIAFYGWVAVIICCFISYGIARTVRYQFGAILIIGILLITIIGTAVGVENGATALPALIMVVLLASIWFELRGTLIVMAVTTTALIFALVSIDDAVNPMLWVLVPTAFILLIVFLNHRNVIEGDRRKELEELNADLRIATLEAQESNRIKSEFLATISHELRTPMNGIIGFCDILLVGIGGKIDEEAEHMINRISVNGDRLLTLINNILDISKMEAGRVELFYSKVNIASLVDNCIGGVSALASVKGIDLRFNITEDIAPVIYSDMERLNQIANNLLSNAIKFTDEGYVELRAKTEGDMLILEVEDTGEGISSHAQTYIFEKFRQGDSSSTRTIQGSGLGLAIVNDITKLMDGNVSLVSSQIEPNKGSTFTVRVKYYTEPQT